MRLLMLMLLLLQLACTTRLDKQTGLQWKERQGTYSQVEGKKRTGKKEGGRKVSERETGNERRATSGERKERDILLIDSMLSVGCFYASSTLLTEYIWCRSNGSGRERAECCFYTLEPGFSIFRRDMYACHQSRPEPDYACLVRKDLALNWLTVQLVHTMYAAAALLLVTTWVLSRYTGNEFGWKRSSLKNLSE